MRSALYGLFVVLCVVAGGWSMRTLAQQPGRPVEPPRTFQYTREQLQQFEAQLRPRMNQYKQAAEQVANFGNQTAWVAHREADGLVEIHEGWKIGRAHV